MANRAAVDKLTGLARRYAAFVAERHPFALNDAIEAIESVLGGRDPGGEAAIESLRPTLRRELTRRLRQRPVPPDLGDTTPRTPAATRIEQAVAALLDDCDGFLRRAAIEASLTRDERKQAEVEHGLVIEDVGGPAARAGIRPGDVLLSVNGKSVDSLEQVRGSLKSQSRTAALLILAPLSALKWIPITALAVAAGLTFLLRHDPDRSTQRGRGRW